MEESSILAVPNHKTLEYDTQYNNKFRPITNTQITTVEISPTGSGKNTFYANSPNTIMLMPTNAMVIEKDGIVSSKKAEEINTDTKKYRTAWEDIDKTKCDYMTYDKFYGHVKERLTRSSDFNIIIDEAHLLFASDNEDYQKLAKALLDRSISFKELKLISATLRVDSLAFFSNYKFDINVYQNEHFAPHIHFVRKFPKVEPTERTLIFINSVDKMYQIVKYLEKKHENIKIMTLSSGSPLPSEQEIKEHNVIISTSVIRQGYSIENTIDKIIIYNINNPEGAIGVLQYMARPRNQSPEVYVVMASTHFNMSKKPEGRDELNIRETTLDIIKQQNLPNSDQTTNEAMTLCIDSWVTKVKQSSIHGNPVLTNYLFEREMKNIELYVDDGIFMKISINGFIPKATIDVDVELDEIEEIKFNKLDVSEYTNELLKLDNVDDKDMKDIVIAKIDDILENVKDSKDMEKNYRNRVIERLGKISKVKPLRDFTMDNVLYKYTDTIIVKQMVDKHTFDRCKWHELNVEIDRNGQDTYTYRDKVVLESKASRLLKIDDKQESSKITHKFKKMCNRVKASKAQDVKLLERMYSFDKYYTDAKTKEQVKIKAKTSNKTEYVIITSLYTVENSWYFKANT